VPHPFAFFLAKGWETTNQKSANHEVRDLERKHNKGKRSGNYCKDAADGSTNRDDSLKQSFRLLRGMLVLFLLLLLRRDPRPRTSLRVYA